MTGYTFRGRNSSFIFELPYKLRSSHNGKNLLPSEQILSFMSRPLFGKTLSSRSANRKSQKLFPCKSMGEKKIAVYPYTLISRYVYCCIVVLRPR